MALRNKGEVELFCFLNIYILLCFVSFVCSGKVKGGEGATQELETLSLVLKQMVLWCLRATRVVISSSFL